MPHTSHKKKFNAHKKRKEIVDGDGWTRISSSSPTAGAVTQQPVEDGTGIVFEWHTASGSVRKTGGKFLRPMPSTPGFTTTSMRAQFDKIETKWRQTDLCKAFKDVLAKRIAEAESKISHCILFGSGSLCGDEVHWIDRHESAYYQVAAFKTAIETIQQAQQQPIRAFAQEPSYNELDAALLASLHITKVDHPEGFNLLGEPSFAYSPAAEPEVELQIMFYDPPIWLHRSLDHLLRDDKIRGDADFTTEEARINLEMTEIFKKKHESAELPAINLKNFPFHGSVIWWQKTT